MMLHIGEDPELSPMRLSLVTRNIAIGLGNNAMNKALSQVAKSPFTRNIEDVSLPR